MRWQDERNAFIDSLQPTASVSRDGTSFLPNQISVLSDASKIRIYCKQNSLSLTRGKEEMVAGPLPDKFSGREALF